VKLPDALVAPLHSNHPHCLKRDNKNTIDTHLGETIAS
jgi:hypothetical protein